MKIYYFGELIEENGRKVNQDKDPKTQMTLDFEATEPEENRIGMPSIGDILKEIDLNLDVYRPGSLQRV